MEPVNLTYRPRIPDRVHEKVERNAIGKRKNLNEIYIKAVDTLLNEYGQRPEWLERLSKYCENNDVSRDEVLTQIVTEVIDENGEANIKFKQKLDLD